jgi:hypothetical protein
MKQDKALGLRPVVAGRSLEKVAALARSHGLQELKGVCAVVVRVVGTAQGDPPNSGAGRADFT